MSNTTGSDLPGSFYDDDGFPLCLLRIQHLVRTRGGQVSGAGREWRLVPLTPNLPTIRVAFGSDGDANIQVSADELIVIDADATYSPYPGHDSTELDAALVAILDGQYEQFTATTADGASAAHGWKLPTEVGTLGTTGYTIAVPTDEHQAAQLKTDWRYHWTRYPAWPTQAMTRGD